MKKTALLSVILSFFLVNSSAQSFQKFIGGPSEEQGRNMIVTNDGGFAISGYTRSYGGSDWDAFVIKTDVNGNQEWVNVIGSTSTEQGFSIIQTTDEGYMLGGGTRSYGVGSRDALLTKMDASGNIQWTKAYGGANDEYARVVRQTLDGGYVFTGYTGSFGSGGTDFLVVKVDANGALQWSKTYGIAGNDYPIYIEPMPNGNFLTMGFHNAGSSWQLFLMMIDGTGNQVWAKTYAAPFGNNVATDAEQLQLSCCNNGDFIFSAYTQSFGAGDYDAMVIRTDSVGNVKWSNAYGNTGFDRAFTLKPTGNGNFLVGGVTRSFGSEALYLLNIDPNGGLNWSKGLLGSALGTRVFFDDIMQITPDGGVAFTGVSSAGAGGNDVLLLKAANLGQSSCFDTVATPTIVTPVSYTVNAFNPTTTNAAVVETTISSMPSLFVTMQDSTVCLDTVTTISLIADDCNRTDIDFYQTLTSDSITGVDTYQFLVINTRTNTSTLYSTTDNTFSLAESGNTDFSTDYQVSVRYVIGTDTSNYGNTCEFTSFDINFQPQQDIFDRFGNKYTSEQIIHGSCPPNWATGNPDITDGIFELSFCYDGSSTNPFTSNIVAAINQAFIDISSSLTQNNCGIQQSVYVAIQAPLGMAAGNPGGIQASSFYKPEEELGASAAFNNSGILYGEVWRAINMGNNDPNEFDAFIDLNFYSTDWTFNDDYTTPNSTLLAALPGDPNEIDLYSVLIHEIIHSLGFASLIDANGQSRLPGWNVYSIFDTYLTSTTSGSLLANTTPYNYQFNVPVGDLNTVPVNGCGLIEFDGTFTIDQPIIDWSVASGTALSHFDDSCYLANDPHLMKGSIAYGEENRTITQHEVNVLIDLGYSTTGNFGDNTLNQHVTGLPANGFNLPIGSNDGGFNNPCGPRFLFELCSPGVDSWTISPLTNDVGTVGYVGLELVQGNGLLTDNGIDFTLAPNNSGEFIVRYVPINANGDVGNITTVLIEVTNCSTNCFLPDVCDLMCNPHIDGGFIPANWFIASGSPDLLGVNSFFRLGANGAWDPDFVESAYTTANILSGEDYTFSYLRKAQNNSLDSAYLFLVTQTGVAAAGFPLGHQGTVQSTVLPSEKQLILVETNLDPNDGWERVTVCFTANQNYDFIWLLPADPGGGGNNGLLVDELELMQTSFGSPDFNSTCGNIAIGQDICDAIGVTYSWNIQGDLTEIGTDSHLATNISQTTTFEAHRNFPVNPGSVQFPAIVDNCNVTEVITVSITNTFSTTLTSTNESCSGTSDGSVSSNTSGGASPYFYIWGNNTGNAITPSVLGLTSGTYEVSITDVNSCFLTESVTITQPTSLLLSVTSTNVTCNGFNDGSAMAAASGGTSGYSYLWSNTINTANNPNLVAGVYTVTTTDANSCTVTQSVTITQPTSLLLSVTSTNVTCNGFSDGSAMAVASGGTSGYSYLWSNTINTASNPSLAAGVYTVTATDANSCTVTQAVTITQPISLLFSVTSSNVSCNGFSDGSAMASASGGTSGYSYLWSNTISTASNPSLAAGVYTVTATDANSCTVTQSVTITEPTIISITLNSFADESCPGVLDGFINVDITGGAAPYTYNWIPNGETTEDLTNVGMGGYTLNVTDAGGVCSGTFNYDLFATCCIHAYAGTLGTPGVLTVIPAIGQTYTGNYLVQGDIKFTVGNVNFTNATFYMAGYSIFNPYTSFDGQRTPIKAGMWQGADQLFGPNIYLEKTTTTITNSTFTSDCGEMWGGIFTVNALNQISFNGNNITMSGTYNEISNSATGLVLHSLADNFLIENTSFLNNGWWSIQLVSYYNISPPTGNIIRNNIFSSDPLTMLSPYNYLSPVNQYYSYYGIKVFADNSKVLIEGNTFNNILIGVGGVEASSINVQNNNTFQGDFFVGIRNTGSNDIVYIGGSPVFTDRTLIRSNTFNFSATPINNIQKTTFRQYNRMYAKGSIGILSEGSVGITFNNFYGSLLIDNTLRQTAIVQSNEYALTANNFRIGKNNIYNIKQGIKCYATRAPSGGVGKNNIDNCEKGIFIQNGISLQVRQNIITNIPPATSPNGDTYGLFAIGQITNGLITEKNSFSGMGTIGTGGFNSYGIIIENSANTSSRVFDNTFLNTDIGIQTQGINDNLKIKCNTFGTPTTGFGTSAWVSLGLNSNPGTLRDQGSTACSGNSQIAKQSGAGNKWLYGCTSVTMDDKMIAQNTPYTYYFHENNQFGAPTTNPNAVTVCTTGSMFFQSCGANNDETFSSCIAGSQVQGMIIPPNDPTFVTAALIAITDAKTQVTNAQQGIDGGQTTAMLNVISGYQGTGANQIKTTLLQNTPLSTEVLVWTINKNHVLPDEQVVRPVLLANAPLNDAILMAAFNRPAGLSDKTYEKILKASAPLSVTIMLEVLDPNRNLSDKTIRKALKETAEWQSLPDEVLLTMLSRNPSLSANTIKEVFKESVPLSATVLDVLQNQMSPPLPNGILNDILEEHNEALNGEDDEDEDEDDPSTGSGQSDDDEDDSGEEDDDSDDDDQRIGEVRDVLENEIAYNTQTINEIESELLSIYLDTGDVASARALLTQSQFPYAKKMLAELELSEGNYAAARAILTTIAQSGAAEDLKYVDLTTVLIDLADAGTELFDMSAAQEQTVRNVAASGTLVATQAEVVLTIAFGDEFEHPIMKIQSTTARMANPYYGYWGDTEDDSNNQLPTSDTQLQASHFKLYPNPTDGNITLEYQLQDKDEAIFYLWDVTGKTIVKMKLLSSATSQQILVNNLLHSGVYHYQLKVNERIIKTDKLIVIEK